MNSGYLNVLIKVHADELRVGKFVHPSSAALVMFLLKNDGYSNVSSECGISYPISTLNVFGWKASSTWDTAHFRVGSKWFCGNALYAAPIAATVDNVGLIDPKPHCVHCQRSYNMIYRDIVQGLNANFEFLVDLLPLVAGER